MTPEEFFKEQRVPKYRQRLVAALCSSITAESDEKSEFFAEIADFEALEFSEKQIVFFPEKSFCFSRNRTDFSDCLGTFPKLSGKNQNISEKV